MERVRLLGCWVTFFVKEVFYTLQGEGYWSGRAAVFCRFSRCNLWTGREADRATALCDFCDTEFSGGDRVSQDDLVDMIWSAWPMGAVKPMVVFTGGEPLLQLDEGLINSVKDLGFYVAVETNGTMPVPNSIDWVCVSPKVIEKTVVKWANELKLVYPQQKINPEMFVNFPADWLWLSPMDGPNLEANTAAAVEYVMADPRWRLNIQTHKVIGVR